MYYRALFDLEINKIYFGNECHESCKTCNGPYNDNCITCDQIYYL
jgi:hypothetical protein